MNPRIFLFTILCFASITASMAQTPTPSATPDAFPCPADGSGTAIQTWRDGLIDKMNINGDYGYYNVSGTTENLQKINKCFLKEVPACLVTLKKFLRANSHDTPYDQSNIKTTPQRQIPKELLESGADDFKYVFKSNPEKIAEKNGWPVVKYKSRHSGGFEHSTSSLMMIEVPGDKCNPPVDYDRFINLTLQADDKHDATNVVPTKDFATKEQLNGPKSNSFPSVTTMVTVKRATKDSPSEIYFQMFDRQNGTAVYNPSRPSQGRSCYSCHSSGLRQISPLGFHVRDGEKQLPVKDWKTVEKINMDMTAAAGGKPSDWRSVTDKDGEKVSYLDPESMGPTFGPIKPLNRIVTTKDGVTTETYPTRTKDFILGDGIKPGCATSRTTVNVRDILGRAPGDKNVYTFTSNPPVRWERVATSMSCQDCHNGVYRGRLNEATGRSTIDFKILVDQSMPGFSHMDPLDRGSRHAHSKDDLNPNERIALANCLRAEFAIEQTHTADWLKDTQCKDEPDYVKDQMNRVLNETNPGNKAPSCTVPNAH